MTYLEYICRAVVLFMAVLIMAAHIVPTSLHLLDSEFCLIENFTDSEVEEKEKELVRLAESNEIIGVLNAISYADHFEALPPTPFLETLCPPPDFS